MPFVRPGSSRAAFHSRHGLQVGHFGLQGFHLGLAAEHGPDAGAQLAGVEGLDQVIVRPHLQAHDFVHVLVPGSEHDDGHRAARAPQTAQHFKAIHARQHHVEHHQIGGVSVHVSQSLFAAGYRPLCESLPLQAFPHDGDDGWFVIYYQDIPHCSLHLLSRCLRGTACAGRPWCY